VRSEFLFFDFFLIFRSDLSEGLGVEEAAIFAIGSFRPSFRVGACECFFESGRFRFIQFAVASAMRANIDPRRWTGVVLRLVSVTLRESLMFWMSFSSARWIGAEA